MLAWPVILALGLGFIGEMGKGKNPPGPPGPSPPLLALRPWLWLVLEVREGVEQPCQNQPNHLNHPFIYFNY